MEKKLERIQTHRNGRMKDRGDMQRKRLHKEVEIQKHPPDRGDLKFRQIKQVDPQKKFKLSIPQEHTTELVSQSTNTCGIPKLTRIIEKPESTEYRQRIRDRYTLKPKGNLKVQIKKDEQFSFVQDDLSANSYFRKESSEPTERPKASPETKSERSTKLHRPAKRKPIMKTSKHVSRVPKVVTFMEMNSKPFPIRTSNYDRDARIRLPKLVKRGASIETSKLSDKAVVKRRRNVTRGRVDTRVQHMPSPESSQELIASPPTEVAKWTAASVNKHTRPYYEAWVDTTLAAISKFSKKDKLYIEKQKVLQTFKNELQRQLSPELVYTHITDERYAGKIRVRQK